MGGNVPAYSKPRASDFSYPVPRHPPMHVGRTARDSAGDPNRSRHMAVEALMQALYVAAAAGDEEARLMLRMLAVSQFEIRDA